MSSARLNTIHRVVLPLDEVDDAILSLYVSALPGAIASYDRESITLSPRSTASWNSYFGALPLGWWRAFTTVERVRLTLVIDADANVRVLRSDASGATAVVAEQTVVAGEFSIELEAGLAEGWAWFEVTAGGEPVTVRNASWSAAEERQATRNPTLTVCITTFDREIDCIAVLATLARAADELSGIDRVVVVDQGTRAVADAAGFDDVARIFGPTLEVVRQSNLGGSGGFSRGMLRAADAGSDFALLLDDDVRVEPESIQRLLRFAAHAASPTIVGAQMLDLAAPTRLHSFGERIDPDSFWWGPVASSLAGIDLAHRALSDIADIHRVREVDFNGWWMCLIPTSHIRAHGAALPLFIKWDDAEYALRARANGVPTVTLPGAAVWHAAWVGKDDGLDWQAYFQLRNRVIAAMSTGVRPRRLLTTSLLQDLNHLLCQQYGSVALRTRALKDAALGPARLTATARTVLLENRRVLQDEGQTIVAEADAPPARSTARRIDAPVGVTATVVRAARVAVMQVVPGRSRTRVDRRLTRIEGRWWGIGLLSSATVASATGRGVFVMRRRPAHAARLLFAAVATRIRLVFGWRRTMRAYRDAASTLASAESWQAIFEDDGPLTRDRAK